jgi:hypothetical protein
MKFHVFCAALMLAALGAGCDDTDPQWELDNDRIIAVRASSPQLAPGDRATLDIFVTADGKGPSVMQPAIAIVVALDPTNNQVDDPQDVPEPLQRALRFENSQWTVVAPSAAELDQVRGELGIAAGQPVPMVVGVQVDPGGGVLNAIKTIALGGPTSPNPTLGAVTINGVPAQDGLVLPMDVEIPMTVEVGEEDEVYWLSSIGALSDFDDPRAELEHEKGTDDHLLEGHIAVVVRTKEGGVTWGFWTARIE